MVPTAAAVSFAMDVPGDVMDDPNGIRYTSCLLSELVPTASMMMMLLAAFVFVAVVLPA